MFNLANSLFCFSSKNMLAFEYLKALCRDDEVRMDFLEHSLKVSMIHCCFEGFTYCGNCCDKYKRMKYLFEVSWHQSRNLSYDQKKKLFVICSIRYTDIFVELYKNFYAALSSVPSLNIR